MPSASDRSTCWRLGVDVGGTFADCIAVTPEGLVRRLKLLSNGRRRAAAAVVPCDARGGANEQCLRVHHMPAWCVPALVGCNVRVGSEDCSEDSKRTESVVARVVRADVDPGGDGAIIAVAAQGATSRPPAATTAAAPSAGAPATSSTCTIEIWSDREAPVWAAHLLTGTPLARALPPHVMQLSTTRGTNALLESEPRDVGLVTNEGLEGLLAVGTQQRLGIFDLVARKPPVLAGSTLGVRARLAADGQELQPVDRDEVRAVARALHARGVRHVAVALMHSWRDASHERAVADVLRAEGFESVCTSAELAAVPRLVPRAQTAVVEARLHTPVRAYLQRVAEGLGGELRVATSAGGVVPSASYRAKDSLLSGPAAGCAGAVATMRSASMQGAITFDMGGTSTDVARLDQHGAAMRFETTVAGSAVATPSVDVHSVAAGGGSVCVATQHGLFVGPVSAGADPGPACYGRGGPLTITDVNVLLGRLWEGASSLPLDVAAAHRQARAQAVASGRDVQSMLAGFLEVAHEHMAAAVRRVSTSAGHDPRTHALLAFGGAGGQHACAVAERLGMTRVLVPAHAGFVSAEGALRAPLERTAEEAVLAPLGDGRALASAIARAEHTARAACAKDGVASPDRVRAVALLRAKDRAGALAFDAVGRTAQELREAFRERMAALNDPAANSEPEVESVRVSVGELPLAAGAEPGTAVTSAVGSATGSPARALPSPLGFTRAPARGPAQAHARGPAQPPARGPTRAPARGPAQAPLEQLGSGGSAPCPVYAWEALAPSHEVSGPAIIVGDGATVVVEQGWLARADTQAGIHLEHARVRVSAADDRTNLEVAAARFVAIGSWMGTCLERSARSVNVKERLDFSCGILNPRAELVANAPHIPVHLGALGACARAMLAHVALAPGEAAITNDPRFGGSHLPDLTVLRAVHAPCGTHLGYVAARAHHAEIGGCTPGSMPPDARTLAEEGVVIPPTVIARHGRLDEAAVRTLLATGPWPSRDPDSNVADLQAAIGALDAGAEAICELARERGTAATLHAMDVLLERSAHLVRTLAHTMAEHGVRRAESRLDDGTPLEVTLHPHADGTIDVRIDAPTAHPGNFNAPLSVTQSAVLYVLRVLVGSSAAGGQTLDDHIAPLNEGFLRPVRLVVTPGFLNPFESESAVALAATDPALLPAVFAGNTESSQRVVEALLLACGVAANSQGTMNNLVFGNDRFSVYETIGGGAGASAHAAGASAVHVHMSNTRLTDPETLELRHPVRLERMQVRVESGGAGGPLASATESRGGAGTLHGGDGIARRIRMLEPVTVCFVSQHRVEPPAGCAGGEPGALGEQFVVRADGTEVAMPGVFRANLQAGDAVEIRTPGGGGFGRAPSSPPTPRSS